MIKLTRHFNIGRFEMAKTENRFLKYEAYTSFGEEGKEKCEEKNYTLKTSDDDAITKSLLQCIKGGTKEQFLDELTKSYIYPSHYTSSICDQHKSSRDNRVYEYYYKEPVW